MLVVIHYRQVAIADPRIGAFDGALHHQNVDDFRRLDTRHIAGTAARVKRACAERLTRARDEFRDQSLLVEAQAARQRGHKPIRELFADAPEVLTALKPCWAMSPLLVSQLLPGDVPYFDVVVFDEASQVLPADAVPALLRARRAVVAGDDRQLPPTSFFTAALTEDDEETEQADLAFTSGFESILDTLAPLLRMRMLIWHYRSHDERLIAFSNLHLYDRALTTFPGISGDECLEHVLVTQPPGVGGQEDSSSAEVQVVVERVLEHARTRPNESLGVISMGIKHANRISEALRRARTADPRFEAFFDETLEEAFFVKNLERVQGDERDAIILSVGYGKTADGRLLYRFGPLCSRATWSTQPAGVAALARPRSPRLSSTRSRFRYAMPSRRLRSRSSHSTGLPVTVSISLPGTRPSPVAWCSPSNATVPAITPLRRQETGTGSAKISLKSSGGAFTASGRPSGSATRRRR